MNAPGNARYDAGVGADDRGGVRALLAKVAPGSALREGVDRVLRARMGALIVLGDRREVLEICSGGFHLDSELTPQRLSELAKMDGAMVLDAGATRIAWANVHLVPEPTVPTTETGTRHRTAERVARSVDVPVIAVSEEMGTITIYRRELRHVVRPTENLIARATYLLSTMERFRQRFDEADSALTASEIGDVVTAGDVALLLQRSEMLLRIGEAVDDLLDELGEHGRLLHLQLRELVSGVSDERRLVLEDYLAAPSQLRSYSPESVARRLEDLPTDDLLGIDRFVAALGELDVVDLATPLEPRGLRLLNRMSQLAPETTRELIARFGTLHQLVRATALDLASAAGLSPEQAQLVKDGLARLAESSILDRYH